MGGISDFLTKYPNSGKKMGAGEGGVNFLTNWHRIQI